MECVPGSKVSDEILQRNLLKPKLSPQLFTLSWDFKYNFYPWSPELINSPG
jgi:hypothetical protein